MPRQCACAAALEASEYGVPRSREGGLRVSELSACDEDEDAVSMALTAVSRLVEAHGLRYEDVGMLQVASESLLDRSKSVKSHLMALFGGCADIEGLDAYDGACGGVQALLACVSWLDSLTLHRAPLDRGER